MENVYVLRITSNYHAEQPYITIICQSTGRKVRVLLTSFELSDIEVAYNKLIEHGYKVIGRCRKFIVIPVDRPLPRLASYNNFI
mgnify:CR=1 FL=1